MNTNLDDRDKDINISPPFSQQAELLLEQMPDINREELKLWWMKNHFIIGSNPVIEFLSYKKKHNK